MHVAMWGLHNDPYRHTCILCQQGLSPVAWGFFITNIT
jgi:hypothetical protein